MWAPFCEWYSLKRKKRGAKQVIRIKTFVGLNFADYDDLINDFLSQNEATPISITEQPMHDWSHTGEVMNQWMDVVLVYSVEVQDES